MEVNRERDQAQKREAMPGMEQAQDVGTPVAAGRAGLYRMHRAVGNRAVGRLLQRSAGQEAVRPRAARVVQREDGEDAGGAAAEEVEVPSVTGSGPIGIIGDILGCLDTAVGIVDLFGVAALEAGGALAAAPFITGPLAAIAFIVGGIVTTVEAGMAGEKLAAVQGASYGITSVAFGRATPSAPGWMGHGEQFNRSASQVRERITERIEQRGEAGRRMAGALASLREQGAEAALNSTYQRLVEEHLQLSFLGFSAGGGLYANARRFRLTWPQVGMTRIRERAE